MLVSINLPIIYFNLYFIYPSTVFPNPLKYAVDNIATSKRIPEHERVDALFFIHVLNMKGPQTKTEPENNSD